MVSAWVEHIRDFARRKSMTYGCALSDPECRAEYHAKRPPKLNKKEKKEVAGMEAEDRNILSIPVKKTRGRPKKYSTNEERKKAKTIKTVESNKRKRQEKKGMTGTGASASTSFKLGNQYIDQIVDYLREKHTQEEDNTVRTALLELLKDKGLPIPKFIRLFKEQEDSPEYLDKLLDFLGLPATERAEREEMNKEDKETYKKTIERPQAPSRNRRADIFFPTGKGMKGGMVSNELKKTDVNKIINFITHYVNTKTPDPEFERYIREDIGEDDIVSRFADTILGADIPNLSQEDKKNLIPDLYGYIKHYFSNYKDKNLSISQLKKMRGVGIKGGKLKPPPEIPLTEAQGRAILDEVQTNGGNLLPITEARHFNLRRVIEEIGGFAPIEDMRDRFEFFVSNFLHPAQRSGVMANYDSILAFNPKKRKLQGGKIPYRPENKDTVNINTLRLTDEQGQAIINSIVNEGFIPSSLMAQRGLNRVLNAIQEELSLDNVNHIRGLFIEFLNNLNFSREDINTILRHYDDILNYKQPSTPPPPKKKKRDDNDNDNDRNVIQRINLGFGLKGGKLPLKFKSKIKKLGDKILPEPMRRNNMPLPQTLTQEEIAEQTFDNFMERVANTTAQRRPRRRNTPPPRPLTQEEIDEEAEDEAIEARLRGTGIIAGSNGLSHIYPLSHDNILKMCKHLA